jgi:hypothetical protein
VWWFILGYSSFNIYLSRTKQLLAEVAPGSPMGLLQALAELLAVLMMVGVKKLPFKPESLRFTAVLCTAFAAVVGLGIRLQGMAVIAYVAFPAMLPALYACATSSIGLALPGGQTTYASAFSLLELVGLFVASILSHVYSLVGLRTASYMILGGALQSVLLVILLDPRRAQAVASTPRADGDEDVTLG